MSDKKIIVVFGATGSQGGGLVRAIQNDKNSEFTVRAVTRDINSDKAKALAALGAEVVAGDVDDKASIQKALEGAYGAYFVTFFWHHFSPEKETAEAKIYAESAKAAGLKHVIWSTLEDTREFVPIESDKMPTLMGKYKVPHFDAKAEGNKFFTESGVPVTFLYASFYWENLLGGVAPQKISEGKYVLTVPMGDKKLAGVAAEDIGKSAYGIFKKGKELAGKRIGLASDHLTIAEITKKMSQATGKDISYNPVSPDAFRAFGFPGAEEFGNMFQFYADFEKEGLELRDVKKTRELNPELKSFDTWLNENKDRLPLALYLFVYITEINPLLLL